MSEGKTEKIDALQTIKDRLRKKLVAKSITKAQSRGEIICFYENHETFKMISYPISGDKVKVPKHVNSDNSKASLQLARYKVPSHVEVEVLE